VTTSFYFKREEFKKRKKMVEITTRDALEEKKLPPSDSYITCFVPRDKVSEVQKNLYLQLESAESIKNNSWAIEVQTQLKNIIKTFKNNKIAISESLSGYSFYTSPHESKVYVLTVCPPVDDIKKSVLCDYCWNFTCP
jgi:hypothetical protein